MKEKLRHFLFDSNIFMMILVPLTFFGVTATSIVTNQAFFRILPLYVSLLILLLNSRVNRYGLLIGSLNSILYGFVYLHYNLYGSAISAFLVSLPLQLITFILWSKHSYKHSTVFRKMSPRMRLLTALGSIVAYVIYVFAMKNTDANYLYLDSIIMISGIVVPILTLFALVEYAYVSMLTAPVSVLMYVLLSFETPEQLPYLIFNIYSCVCCARQLYNARSLFSEQQSADKPSSVEIIEVKA